jgi:hypothetical protein
VLVLGKQINVLELVNLKQGCPEVVGGRYLFDWARAGLAGLRKALPFLHQYVDKNKDTGQILQSGMEMEDVLCATLDNLHEYETTHKLDKALKPEEEAIAEKKKADAEEEEEEEQAVAEAGLLLCSSVGSSEEEKDDKTINKNDGTANCNVPVVT